MPNFKNFQWVQIADLSLYNSHHRRTSPINSQHSVDSVGRPYNRSQTKLQSAILNLQNFDSLICICIYICNKFLEPNYAAAHQISLKSDDPQLSYSDETGFKMAVVRHLEFSNFGILVT